MPVALEKWPIKPDKARNSKAKSEEILSQTRINVVNSSSTRVVATLHLLPKKLSGISNIPYGGRAVAPSLAYCLCLNV
jgi:hypothetical protein